MSEENNHIEDFFRKHLDVEQDTYLEEDWAKMEAKLDAAGLGADTAPFWSVTKLIFGAIIIALLFFGAGWWMNQLMNPENESYDQYLRDTPKSNNNAAIFTSRDIFNISADQCEETNAATAIGKNDLVNVANRFNHYNERINHLDMLDTRTPVIIYYYVPKHISSILLEQEEPSFAKLELIKDEFDDEEIKTSIGDKKEKKGVQWTDWSIGASFAPDFNSIGLFEQKQATGKVGLRAYWNFLPRTSLQFGVFYNHKKYTASGEDYHPPYGYWATKTNGKVPENVQGSCRVIDIPVFISYQVAETKRWKFGDYTGLSNYIMLDQEYIYEFDQPNTGYAGSWQSDDNLTLKWSILNLGVSAEYFLNRNISLSVEPYLQAPLQQIGWANVSLFGTGALFTLKKNINPKLSNK